MTKKGRLSKKEQAYIAEHSDDSEGQDRLVNGFIYTHCKLLIDGINTEAKTLLSIGRADDSDDLQSVATIPSLSPSQLTLILMIFELLTKAPKRYRRLCPVSWLA